MGSSDERSVLAALEQAEMAARERRLAASSEAESITAAARQRTSAIAAGAVQRVEAALDELRRSAEEAADAAIEDLELSATRQASMNRRTADAGVERAVSVVVAHVLGEAMARSDRERLG